MYLAGEPRDLLTADRRLFTGDQRGEKKQLSVPSPSSLTPDYCRTDVGPLPSLDTLNQTCGGQIDPLLKKLCFITK
jgi:hypothetical protein